MSRRRETFFATCAPGLEPALHAEAKELRLAKLERQVGGVRFEGTMRDAWRANLWLRTAIRVLLRVARFPAPDADSLYDGVQTIDWRRYLAADGRLIVDAQTRDSQLDHSRFVEQRTKDAIVDQLRSAAGVRPSVDRDDPDLAVHVHLSRDRCTVSVDTSGDSLHKRGWRVFQGAAPLAETLAAGVVLLSGWDRRAPLLDPFAGSGTLLIEAALIARGIPPGMFRERFAFERLPEHRAGAWRELRRAEIEGARAPQRRGPTLRGVEIDPETLAGAHANLEAAGVADRVEIEPGDALSMDLKPGWNAWIATNPPYGERVGEGDDLHALYRALGERLRAEASGYRLALLSGNPGLTMALGFPLADIVDLQNGAIPCDLVRAVIP